MDMIDLKTKESLQARPEKKTKKLFRIRLVVSLLVASVAICLLIFLPAKKPATTQVTIPLPIDLNQVKSLTDFSKLRLTYPLNDLQSALDEFIRPNIRSYSTQITQWAEITVEAGDTLSTVFDRMSLTQRDMIDVLSAAPEAEQLTQIYPGNKLLFTLGEDGKLEKLHYVRNPLESLLLTRHKKGYKVTTILREPEVRTTFASATIKDSLFLTIQKTGFSGTLAMNLANIFGWDIDFALDIRDGDSFHVVFEEHYLDGRKIRDGDIISAQFTNRGNTFTAIRYTNDKGETEYYTPDGLAVRKQFLRTPVDFARITSKFNLSRYHPILHKIRAHKGVDYAAKTGTPVKASGSGKIEFCGRKGGYGNTIVIDHGNTYSTLYAHLNKFAPGIHSGKRIKQGQIIGYVGSSGLATGPHLHYEFRINGVHKNPLTVKVAYSQPINADEKPQFKAHVEKVIAQLNSFKLANKIAGNTTPGHSS